MSEPPYRGRSVPSPWPSGRPAPPSAGPGFGGGQGGSYGASGASGGLGPGGAAFAAYGPPQQPYGGNGGHGQRGQGHGQGGYGQHGHGQHGYGQHGHGGPSAGSWGPPAQAAPPPAYDPRSHHGGHAGTYGAYQEPADAAGLPLAPIHRRAGARLIDTLLVWAFGFALIFPLAVGAIGSDGGAKGGDGGGGWNTVSLTTTFIVMAVLPFLYEAVQLSMWGQTLGKRYLALSVVRVTPAGDPLPVTQAVRRSAINNIGYQLSIFLFLLVGVTLFRYALILMVLVAVGVLIAYLWAIFDQPLHQTIHDRFAGTVVVDDRVDLEAEYAEAEAGYDEAGYEYE